MTDKIKRDDWKGLNFRKIEEHQKELEEYPGNIPLRLYDYINIGNRLDYLDKIGEQYEYKNIESYRKRNDSEKDIADIIRFVNDNPEFMEIIKVG